MTLAMPSGSATSSRSSHPQTANRMPTCQYCGEEFPSNNELMEHIFIEPCRQRNEQLGARPGRASGPDAFYQVLEASPRLLPGGDLRLGAGVERVVTVGRLQQQQQQQQQQRRRPDPRDGDDLVLLEELRRENARLRRERNDARRKRDQALEQLGFEADENVRLRRERDDEMRENDYLRSERERFLRLPRSASYNQAPSPVVRDQYRR